MFSGHQSRCFSAAQSKDHGEAAVLLRHMGSADEQRSPAVQWRTPTGADGEGSCDPQGAQSGASLLAGFAIPWATHARVIHEELQPEVRAYIEEDYGRLSPMGDTPCWSRERE